MKSWIIIIIVLVAFPLLIAILLDPTPVETVTEPQITTVPKILGYTVVESYPHSDEDFIQGFYMESENVYIESTGLYGKSKL